MKFSASFASVFLAGSTVALPVSSSDSSRWLKGGWNPRRSVTDTSMTDIDILHYALTLEHVEDAFYRQGLANYTHQDFVNAGFPDPFYDDLKEISADETAHVQFLTDTLKSLGAAVSAECTYSFPSTDAASFVGLANIIEGRFATHLPSLHISEIISSSHIS